MAFFDVLLGAVKGGATEGLRQEQERLSLLRQQSLEQLRTANMSAARRLEKVGDAREQLRGIAPYLPKDLDIDSMSDEQVVSFVGGPIFSAAYKAGEADASVNIRRSLGTDISEAELEADAINAKITAGVPQAEGQYAGIRARLAEKYGPDKDKDPSSQKIEELHDKFNKQADFYSDSFEDTFGSEAPTQHVGAARVVSSTLFRDVGDQVVIRDKVIGPSMFRSFMEDFTRDNREAIVNTAKILGTPGAAGSEEYNTRMAQLRSSALTALGLEDAAPTRRPPLSLPPAELPEAGSIFDITPEDVESTTDMGTTRNRSNSRTRGSIAQQRSNQTSALDSLDPMARARQEIGGEQETSPEAFEGALRGYITQLRAGRGTAETRRRTVGLIYQFISSQNSDATVADAEKILEELLSGE